ncbi:MAG: CBS domain-containing protein [Anaerolineaceae bacterium]|nr:CBS domain-containing protein [Anaerolineaceae bacterium]
MCKVKEILRKKENEIYSVGPDATIMDALKLMAAYGIGVVLVIENSKILGIFSERDCVYDLAENRNCSLNSPVIMYMTSPVYYVTPDQTLEDCMNVMTAKNIRHLPVLKDDDVVGIVSIGDVIKTLIGERDESIKDLEQFLWVNLI